MAKIFTTPRVRLKQTSLGVVSLAALSAAMGAAPAAAQSSTVQSSQAVKFSVDAQALDRTIREIGEQSGAQIVLYTEDTKGMRASRLEGDYTVEQALDVVLKDTNLEYRRVNDRTIAVAPSVRFAFADAGDDFREDALVRVSQILSEDASDQSSDSDERGSTTLEIDTIVVTGTNIKGVENPTVPVTSFSRDEILNSGRTSLADFTRLIPQNLGLTTPIGSFNPGASQFDVSNGLEGTAVDLRGLGPGSTVTLLNGRRVASSSGDGFVDIGAIPTSIIDSVHVLADGASPIYGADAVGGVFNIVTRQDFEGVELNVRGGSVTNGGKRDYQASATAGVNWESGSGVLSVSHENEGKLLFSERDYLGDASRPIFVSGTSVPDQLKTSVYASANQQVTDKLKFQVDGVFTVRDSFLRNVFDNEPYEVNVKSTFISSRLEYELTDGLFVEAFGDYSVNDGETESRNSIFTSYIDKLWVGELRLGGELFSIAGRDISGALGAQFRQEGFDRTRTRTGVEGPSSFDVASDRHSYAFYGEALVPVATLENRIPLVRRLELSLAARYEEYKDLGGDLTPKIGVYWETLPGLSFRGGYSQSFRAPTQDELFGTKSIIFTGWDNPGLGPDAADPRLQNGLVYGAGLDGSNPDLETEQADVWNIGIDAEPEFIQGLSFGVTYFNINYKNRVFDVSPFRVAGVSSFGFPPFPEFRPLLDVSPDPAEIQGYLDDPDIFVSNSFRFVEVERGDPTLITPVAEDVVVLARGGFQNTSVSTVRGLDFYLDYGFDAPVGEVDFSLNGTYLIDNLFKLSDVAEEVDRLDLVYRPLDLRLRATAAWSHNGFTALGSVNFAGSYFDDVNEPELDDGGNVIPRPVDSWTTVDVGVSYDFGAAGFDGFLNGMRVALNVTNVFDQDPPRVANERGFNYDTANADPLGRYVSASLTKAF